jgi:hypothetical protein
MKESRPRWSWKSQNPEEKNNATYRLHFSLTFDEKHGNKCDSKIVIVGVLMTKKRVLATTAIKVILGVCLDRPDVRDLMSSLSVYRPKTIKGFSRQELIDLAEACAKHIFSSCGINGTVTGLEKIKEDVVTQTRERMQSFPGIGSFAEKADLTFEHLEDSVLKDYSEAMNIALGPFLKSWGIPAVIIIDSDTQ